MRFYQYYPMLKKTSAPEQYHSLFDQTFFIRCNKSPGYRKYIVESISFLPKDINVLLLDDIKVILSLRGTHYKDKSGSLMKEFDLDSDCKLQPRFKYIFHTAVDYFKYMEESEALHKRNVKASPQYKFEFNQIRLKHPEYFL